MLLNACIDQREEFLVRRVVNERSGLLWHSIAIQLESLLHLLLNVVERVRRDIALLTSFLKLVDLLQRNNFHRITVFVDPDYFNISPESLCEVLERKSGLADWSSVTVIVQAEDMRIRVWHGHTG